MQGESTRVIIMFKSLLNDMYMPEVSDLSSACISGRTSISLHQYLNNGTNHFTGFQPLF